jgi:histidinol-phosphatase (PHP family)
MQNMQTEPLPKRVSIHGGHSGEFCHHAQDDLEAIICAYIDQGFAWVGITEHIPPPKDRFLWPDEVDAGLTAESLYRQFIAYGPTVRHLQKKYADRIRIYLGIETEMYSGALEWTRKIVKQQQPDYLVGSIHHVNDLGLDYSKKWYQRAAQKAGGIDALYCQYFDTQLTMIDTLRPRVVGHFDLIRIYDDQYHERVQKPAIVKRIDRNLIKIKELGLILDFNLRALLKGASEPYITKPILQKARDWKIPVVPGDDSHGIANVGQHIDEGIQLLKELGFNTDWPTPN